MTGILIRGGTVIDGTGAAAFVADVRIEDGLISEIAASLDTRPGEDVIDASGCYVTPGFIESHTHYDATMWWQPDLDPLPGNGVSTVILGNCGFTAAPLSRDKAAQMEMINIFSFFEDIPLKPFLQHVPWDWEKWSEYRQSMERNIKVPANYSAFVGHIALRLAVMGLEAWDRAATAEEVARMCELLEDALAAGALGLSDNLHDHDGDNRPVPSLLADDTEFEALLDVLSRYPGATYQVIIDTFMRLTAPQDLERLERLSKGRNIRMQVAGAIPTLKFQKPMLDKLKPQVEQMQKNGVDIWPGFAHVATTSVLGLTKSLIFAQSNDYVWHEVVMAPTREEKMRLLADPEWRARARASWDNEAWPQSPMNNPHNLYLLDSENGTGPINITLKDLADSRGLHRSDAMADWILENGTMSTVHMAPLEKDEEETVRLMLDDKSVGNISDAGAHLQMLCGGGENIQLFTKYVGEGMISLDQAIHLKTGKLANFFGLHETGEIKPGKRADVVVFNLDEIEYRDMEKRWDVPDGEGGTTWRFTRQPAPMRYTLVNGVVTFDGDKATGAMPGVYLAPTPGQTAGRQLEAAE
jgi:N-acyl-D-aspartate/D-glutamate deacylase